MFILNITCLVDNSISEEFLNWLINDYMPSIKKGNNVDAVKIIKILDSPNEGQTYTLQLHAQNESSFSHFRDIQLPLLQHKMQVEHLGKLFLFDSLMEVIA
ncbi:DUF4286 family protein [Olivibacter sitiensis]|uniref:DUF4286 family protein n=1 Tax=Olivibacter sitiensis TaxID=376470 RepID=UPI00041F184B|nr:DUF4286 family protein [Olivibacter sitiensis]